MKQFITFMFLLLASRGFSQKVSVDNFAATKHITGAVELNKQEENEFKKTKFSKSIAETFNGHIYKKGNMYLSYQYEYGDITDQDASLQLRGNTLVHLMNVFHIIVDTSYIAVFNGLSYSIIIHEDPNQVYRIGFNSEFIDAEKRYINGFIEYPKKEEKEAKEYLKNFLDNLSIKKE